MPSTMVCGADPEKVGVKGVVEVEMGRRKGLECGGRKCRGGCGGAGVSGGDACTEDVCESHGLGWGGGVMLEMVVAGRGRGRVEFAGFGGGRGWGRAEFAFSDGFGPVCFHSISLFLG